MVNVNKNIVPGKKAPVRRPRNTALNSSKKPVSVTHGETHATEQNPFKARLNCSRNLNCSVTGDITSDVYDKLYTRDDDPQKIADMLGCTVEDVTEIDAETENLGYGKTVGHLIAKPEYEEELSQNGIEILSILEDGTVGMLVGNGFHTVETDLEQVLDRVGEDLDNSLDATNDSSKDLNSSADACADDSAKNDTDLDSGCDSDKKDMNSELNCSEDEADDVKIITESGNEVSLSDIKIIQDPNTNEISLFIKEDEDEEIPEGFTVIATATQAALPAADESVCPECGQDPCVCEGGSEGAAEDFDSSKKKTV